ncbi:MAG: hypothetical protein QOH50_4545 [Kribbellaceae bacterium]|nr:hypothetical protein [Kribbellaceae bacterium]
MPTFVPGQTLLRRYWTGGRISVLNIHRVVADDELGLRLWLPAGTPYWRMLTADGRTQHEAPVEAVGESAVLTQVTWRGADVMVWLPPGEAYSVWWFWDPVSGDFQGWYGNLEAAAVRWSDGVVAGVDTVDQALDLWVEPDGSWAWKDLDEFAERTGHQLYWDKTEAARIREWPSGSPNSLQAEASRSTGRGPISVPIRIGRQRSVRRVGTGPERIVRCRSGR